MTQKEQETPQWVPVYQSRLAVPQVSPERNPLHVEAVPVPHQPQAGGAGSQVFNWSAWRFQRCPWSVSTR